MTSPSPTPPAPTPRDPNIINTGIAPLDELATSTIKGILGVLLPAAGVVQTVSGDISGVVNGAQGFLNQFEAGVANTWNVVLNTLAYGLMCFVGLCLLAWGIYELVQAEGGPSVGDAVGAVGKVLPVVG